MVRPLELLPLAFPRFWTICFACPEVRLRGRQTHAIPSRCHMKKLSAAMRRMVNDPDIQAEARATGEAVLAEEEDGAALVKSTFTAGPVNSPAASFVPLNVVNR